MIPRLALDNNKVWVVENNKAVLKDIVTGKEYGDDVEIVSGLTEGEQVIIKGQNTIEVGQTVQISDL
jgi:hypothetical protein